MAAPNLKLFYVGLAAVALIGGGAIFFAKGSGGAEIRTATPIATAADTASMPGYELGSATAPVNVEEYADFECPACQQFAVLTMPDVRDRLINTGQVRWRFRDFPLQQHTKTLFAHEGAACAAEQGKFWEMHDQLYFNQNKWVDARNSAKAVRDYAKAAGVDPTKYDDCISAHRYQGRIAASAKEGAARGVNSTPTLIIGTMMIPGGLTYDSLKAVIQRASGKTKTS